LLLVLSNTAGTGGSGLLIPIGLALFKFDTKNSITLSNFSIFLSSAMRYLLNGKKPHPKKNGTGIMVDLNIGIIMMPMLISGVSFGAILNIVTP